MSDARTSNLVSRLRNSWREDVVALCLKAADEIERLQMTIKRYEPVNTYDGLDIDQWRQRALAAERARSGTVETEVTPKDWPTLCAEEYRRNNPNLPSTTAVLQRTLERHIKWRTTALEFFHQILDGRGSEDEWPKLAEFVEMSETTLRPAVKTNCVDSEGT